MCLQAWPLQSCKQFSEQSVLVLLSNACMLYLHACRVLLCLQALDQALVAPADGHHLTGGAHLVYQGLYGLFNSSHPLTAPCPTTRFSKAGRMLPMQDSLGHYSRTCFPPVGLLVALVKSINYVCRKGYPATRGRLVVHMLILNGYTGRWCICSCCNGHAAQGWYVTNIWHNWLVVTRAGLAHVKWDTK